MAEMIRAKNKKATLPYNRGRHPRTLCVLSRDGRDGGTQYKPAPAAGHSKMVCVVRTGRWCRAVRCAPTSLGLPV